MDRKYEEIINELVEIEMEESCHLDSPEDYNSKLEYYLSNADTDGYTAFLTDSWSVSEEDALEVQEAIVSEIKSRYETIQKAAALHGRKGGKVKSDRKAKTSAENGKLGGRPRIYGNILTNRDVIEAKGYVLTQTAAGKLVRSEPFKERVYRINGVDCIEMDSRSTASGSILHFFALEEIEPNDKGWYIKPTRQARYLWKSWHKNKPEIPRSVLKDEEFYEK